MGWRWRFHLYVGGWRSHCEARHLPEKSAWSRRRSALVRQAAGAGACGDSAVEGITCHMYITHAASHARCRETPSHLLSHYCSWTLHNRGSHRDPADLDRGVDSGVDVYPGVHKLEARFIRLRNWAAGNRISEQCDFASPSIWRLSRSLDITSARTDNSHDTEIRHGSEITDGPRRYSLSLWALP